MVLDEVHGRRAVLAFADILHALGVPAPSLMAWATVAVELLGGLAVLVGAFVALALGGPGPLALDRLLSSRRADTRGE
jgi:uncharacterized membrane protein YphA (DoxX/SURF4 family)